MRSKDRSHTSDRAIIEELRETLGMDDDDILMIQPPFKPDDVLKKHLQEDAI